MLKTRLSGSQIATVLALYKKSLSLNPMVRAGFRAEAEVTVYLRMHTKEIAKTSRICIPTEELFSYKRKSRLLKRTIGLDF